jgi:type VI secretion system protein ImpB
MSSDGTVAPKERVNIVYKTETNGAQEDIELPLKVMVLGEFSTEVEDIRVEDKKIIDINKSNFDDVMKEQSLTLKTEVTSKIEDENNSGDNPSLSLSLDFEKIKDFEPDRLIQNIPELKKLYELRETLKALKGPLGNLPEFRKKLENLITDDETREKLLNEISSQNLNELNENTNENTNEKE